MVEINNDRWLVRHGGALTATKASSPEVLGTGRTNWGVVRLS
jgi:hypothetical protein